MTIQSPGAVASVLTGVCMVIRASLMAPGEESTGQVEGCRAGDQCLKPGLGRSPGEK